MGKALINFNCCCELTLLRHSPVLRKRLATNLLPDNWHGIFKNSPEAHLKGSGASLKHFQVLPLVVNITLHYCTVGVVMFIQHLITYCYLNTKYMDLASRQCKNLICTGKREKLGRKEKGKLTEAT